MQTVLIKVNFTHLI